MTTLAHFGPIFATDFGKKELNLHQEPDMNLIVMASVRGFQKLEETIIVTPKVMNIFTQVKRGINTMKQKHDANTLTSEEISTLVQVVSQLKLYQNSGETDLYRLNEAEKMANHLPGVWPTKNSVSD